MKTKSFNLIWAALGLAAVSLAIFIGWALYANLDKWAQTGREMNHAHAVRDSAQNLYSLSLAASAEVRTYLASGRPADLANLEPNLSSMRRESDFLAKVARTRPQYSPYADRLGALTAARIETARDSALARKKGPLTPAALAARISRGDSLNEAIRLETRGLSDFIRSNTALLGTETGVQEAQRTRIISFVLFLLTLLLLGFLSYLLHEDRLRRQAEALLADTNARLSSVLDSATQISIIATDLSGTITLFSAGAERLLGYRAGEVVGKHTPQLFHLEGEVQARGAVLSKKLGRPVSGFDVFVEPARAGGHETREWTYVARDGRQVPVELMVTGLKDYRGGLTGYLGMAVDIGSRKRAQLKMRKLSAAVRSSPTSIVITDRDGLIEYANPKICELTGYSEKELLGHNPKILSSGNTPKSTFKEMWDTILSGREWQGEILNKKKSGELFWEHAAISPVMDPSGNIQSFVAVKLDITEKKNMEAEMAKAKDAALELARLKADFLANMSHEIRTPMNAIIGMTGLLLGTELSPRQRDYARTIATAGESLLNIINDILDFSKIESGKLVIEVMDFDLAETLESTLELLAQRAQDKGLELEYLLAPEVPLQVRGDPGRLRQILINLVGNAIKFTETGEVILRVGLESGDEKTALLRFAVSDTGPGIPKEAAGKLFREFTQADASTTRKYGGTGLGLSISKRLTELMSGSIGFDSEPGKGTTFWFTVPCALAAGPVRQSPAPELEGLRVLVVDDNAASREILTSHLAQLRMPCTAVASGDEALRELRAAAEGGRPYAAALLDMQMPGMDGRMLAAEIKRQPGLGGPKLILLTSLGQDLTREQLAGDGISLCIHKPIRQSVLLGALRGTLCAGAEAELAAAPAQSGPSPLSRYFRILLTEDNAVNQKVAMRQLEKLGYEASVAANGLEAVAAVKNAPFDLVLMDCQMPEMDGFEATRQIRRLQEGEQRRLPIIAMTANALQGDKEKCLAAGMDDYIPKPVRIEQLSELIARWDAPLDPFTLKDLRELGGEDTPSFLADLLGAYLKDLPERADAIRAAVKSADADALRGAAHALKGSSGNIGARRLQKLCLQLELAGRSGNLEGVAGLMAALELELPAVSEAARKATA